MAMTDVIKKNWGEISAWLRFALLGAGIFATLWGNSHYVTKEEYRVDHVETEQRLKTMELLLVETKFANAQLADHEARIRKLEELERK
jgi:hypothetical protein